MNILGGKMLPHHFGKKAETLTQSLNLKKNIYLFKKNFKNFKDFYSKSNKLRRKICVTSI